LDLLVMLHQAAAGIDEVVALLHGLEIGAPEVRLSLGMQHLACLNRLVAVEAEEVVDD